MATSEAALFESACAGEGISSEDELLRWFDRCRSKYAYSVQQVPLDGLHGWHFDAATGDLVHASGRFFSIRGIEFSVVTETLQRWQQPIIDQPEIGILGFIVRKFDGVLHLLVQAKMEPGNINLVQLSPTVQATRSNYTQVHGGKAPRYIEYFLRQGGRRVLYDQLQSEQGTRYYRKRNRNIVVELHDGTMFPVDDQYAWMTIGQLQRLAAREDLVHLDCRSILGGLSYGSHDSVRTLDRVGGVLPKYGQKVATSMVADIDAGEHTRAEVLSWFTKVKFAAQTRCTIMPLRNVEHWLLQRGIIHHVDDKYFSVLGVSVRAENREVSSWMQPLVHSNDGGVIALVTQMRKGLLHVLVQCRVEPGLMDVAELAPTVQCTPSNYDEGMPPFVDLVQRPADRARVVFDSMLSEEGGRFYHSRQRHLVLELEESETLDLPTNFAWLTLRQLQECGRYSNHLNIELRSIVSCLSPIMAG